MEDLDCGLPALTRPDEANRVTHVNLGAPGARCEVWDTGLRPGRKSSLTSVVPSRKRDWHWDEPRSGVPSRTGCKPHPPLAGC